MNNKDKEAFKAWYLGMNCYEEISRDAWQAACEYKEAENKKLRDALKFYADSTNYSRKIDYKGLHYVSPIGEKFELGEDNGKKAREALKEVEDK